MRTHRHAGTPIGLIAAYWPRLREAVLHDVRTRYGGSVLGVAWAAVGPVLQLSIYAAIYAFILRVRPQGLGTEGYVLMVFSGLVPLLAFNECLVASMNSLTANRALLLNTVFPAELIPLRAALAAQVPGLVGLAVASGLSVALGRGHWGAFLLVPALWVLLVMFAVGIGWVLSLVTLVAKDLQHGIGLVTMLLFVCSPFAYTPDMVPPSLQAVIWFNPLSYFVLSFQSVLCHGMLPPWPAAGGAAALGVGAFFGGFAVFQRAKAVFFDHA